MAFTFPLPVINQTPNPEWSEEFLIAFNQLINHVHSGNDGDADQINAANLLLTADFSLGGYNTINARSYIMQNLSTDPNGINDVCSLYSKTGNLYFNNQLGAHIQITNGNSINIVATVASAWSYLSVSTNFSLLNSDGYTYLAVNTTAARSIFLPSAATVPVGRFIIIKDASGLSETNAITFIPNGADTIDTSGSNYIVKKKFGSWMLVSNGSNGWLVSNYSNKELNDGTIRSNGSDINIIGSSHNVTLTGVNIGTTATGIISNYTPSTIGISGDSGISITTNDTTTITAGNSITAVAVNDINLFATDKIILSGTGGVKVTDGYFYTNTILPNSGTAIAINSTTINLNGNVHVSNSLIADSLSVTNDAFISGGLSVVNNLFVSGTTFESTAANNILAGLGGDTTIGATLSDSLTVNATSSFYNDLTVKSGANLIVEGNAQTGTLVVTGTAQIAGLVSILGDIDLGNSTSDTVSINGKVNVPIQFKTTGRVTEPLFVTPNSNTGISVDLYKNILIPSSTTGTRTYTITGSPVAGDFFYIFNEDSGNHNFTGLVTLTAASGNAYKCMYDGSTWYTHEWFV